MALVGPLQFDRLGSRPWLPHPYPRSALRFGFFSGIPQNSTASSRLFDDRSDCKIHMCIGRRLKAGAPQGISIEGR